MGQKEEEAVSLYTRVQQSSLACKGLPDLHLPLLRPVSVGDQTAEGRRVASTEPEVS